MLLDPNTLSADGIDVARRVEPVAGRQDARLRASSPTTATRPSCTSWTWRPARSPTPTSSPAPSTPAPSWTPRRRRLLLHLGAAAVRRGDAARAPRLRRAALPRARRRSGRGPGRPRADRQSAELPRRHPVEGRPLALRRHPARLERDRRLLPRPAQEATTRGARSSSASAIPLRRRRARRTSSTSSTDDDAPRGRIFASTRSKPERKQLARDRPRAQGRVHRAASAVGEHARRCVPEERLAAGSRCATLDGKLVRDVPLPGIGTVGGVVGDAGRRRGVLLASQSFTTPPRSF